MIKLAEMATDIIEGRRYFDTVKVGGILDDKYYITDISGDKITAWSYFNWNDDGSYESAVARANKKSYKSGKIVLQKKHTFPRSEVEMNVSLDLRSVTNPAWHGIKTVVLLADYKKKEKELKKARAPLTKSQYEKVIRDWGKTIDVSNYDQNFDYGMLADLVGNMVAMNPKVADYAKKKFGRDWKEKIMWALEGYLD